MKILVTGSSGVLGSLLANELEKKGHLVVRVSLKQTNLRNSFTWQDIDSTSFVKDVDVVCHCAFSRSQTVSDLYQSISLSKKIFNWSISNKVKKLVNISSQSVYGDFRNYPSKEKDIINPYDYYGLAKYVCEEFAHSILSNKIDYINIRLASLIGPDFKERSIFKIINAAYVQKKIKIYGGEQLYSYLDVRDAVNGLVFAIERNEPYIKRTYNLGPNNHYTLAELATKVAKILNDNRSEVDISKTQTDAVNIVKMPLNSDDFFHDFKWHPLYTIEDSIKHIFKGIITKNV